MLFNSNPPIFDKIFVETDFTGYPTGQQPSTWTKVQDPTLFTATVEAVAAAHSGKVLRITRNSYGRCLIRFDLVAPISDVEVLQRGRWLSTPGDGNNCLGTIIRASYTDDTGDHLTGYRSIIFQDDGYFSASGRFLDGSGVTLDYSGLGSANINEWWWMRTRMVGSLFQRKIWKYGATEPSYINDTDANIPGPGETGIQITGTGPVIEVDYFAVSRGVGSPPAAIALPF